MLKLVDLSSSLPLFVLRVVSPFVDCELARSFELKIRWPNLAFNPLELSSSLFAASSALPLRLMTTSSFDPDDSRCGL